MSDTTFVPFLQTDANRVKATWLNPVNRWTYGFSTMAAMIAAGAAPSGSPLALVKEYYSGGGQGTGTYQWDATSVATHNGGTVVQVTGVVIGRWKLLHNGVVDLTQFGVKFNNTLGDAAGNTTAFNTAAAASVNATTGFKLTAPPGTCYINPITYTANNLNLQGAGLWLTIFKAGSAGTALFNWNNCGRHTHRDYQIDGNLLVNSCRRFLAQINNACANHYFENIRLTGAVANTDELADAGDAGPDDISHNMFLNNFWETLAPSNSQIKIAGANALSNSWTGGRCVSANGAVNNVKMTAGQFVATNVFFAGATGFDIYSNTGQVIVRACDSESAGFLKTDRLDTTGAFNDSSVHVIDGGCQLRTSGADTILHEAARCLSISDTYCNANITVGYGGGGSPTPLLIRNGGLNFATGKSVVLTGNGIGQDFAYRDSGMSKTASVANTLYLTTSGIQPNSIITFTNGDTTPSVALSQVFIASNSAGTLITTFDDGLEGEIINILATNGNTTLVNGATIKLAGAANLVMTADDTISLQLYGGIWYEKNRSVN